MHWNSLYLVGAIVLASFLLYSLFKRAGSNFDELAYHESKAFGLQIDELEARHVERTAPHQAYLKELGPVAIVSQMAIFMITFPASFIIIFIGSFELHHYFHPQISVPNNIDGLAMTLILFPGFMISLIAAVHAGNLLIYLITPLRRLQERVSNKYPEYMQYQWRRLFNLSLKILLFGIPMIALGIWDPWDVWMTNMLIDVNTFLDSR